MTHDGRNGLIAESYLRTKGLGLHGKVHDGRGGNGRETLRHAEHGLIMNAAIADSLPHGVAVQLNAGMRHHGQRHNLSTLDDISHPLHHISFHLIYSFIASTIPSPYPIDEKHRDLSLYTRTSFYSPCISQ